MSLLDLATLASGVSDVLAWTRHLFALRSTPPGPHWRFRHLKLDIGHGWLRYEIETASRSEPSHDSTLTAAARRQTPRKPAGPGCRKHGGKSPTTPLP
jgi:hypothetical protein